MANIEIDIATATDNELRACVREMARDLCEHGFFFDASDLPFLEAALERWDMSARPDPVELSASLFRALAAAGCGESGAEELADVFAVEFDPDLAEDPDA